MRDRDRCMIAYELFRKFGEFKFKPYRGPDGNDSCIRVELPMVIGALMRNWGVPEGDKAIRNMGLPLCIVKEPLEVKTYYLPEMVSQDGCFSKSAFSVDRCNALFAGKKGDVYRMEYGTEDVVGQEHIDLVRRFGKPLPAGLGYDDGERIALRIKTLNDLSYSSNISVSSLAKDLMEIVEANPNRLLKDEVEYIIRPLGIGVTFDPEQLVYYVESGRLSVEWTSRTNGVDDAIRWALIAPPNHPRKMDAVVRFVLKHRAKTDIVKREITEDGMKINPLWEEYGI